MSMLTDFRKPSFISPEQEESLLKTCNKKYKVIILLMLDCGLRVTEVVRLKCGDFNFTENAVYVESLKKRKADVKRKIYLTQRLTDALGDYWMTLSKNEPNSWLFPCNAGNERGEYMNRKTVWKYIDKISNGTIYPHQLRHTFATNIMLNGADIITARDLLGHSSSATTEIYIHATEERKKQAIKSIDKVSPFRKFYERLFPRPRIFSVPTTQGWTKYHIGRKVELAKLLDLTDKKVNILLLGKQGMGKSHLLDNYQSQQNHIFRIDEMGKIKTTLAGILLALFEGDKENIKNLLYNNLDQESLGKVITKESIKRLCELLIQVTQKHEYTLIIDDVTKLTPTDINTLEKLKNHFHLIVAARYVKIENATFLTNFTKIELKELPRHEAIELINRSSQDMRDRIEDYELFKNYILQNTNGNPLFTLELIDRFRKESYISNELLRSIKHTAALPEWDMSLPILILFSSLMILRYLGSEIGGDDTGAFKLIGGAFLIFALFARNIFRITKRKFV